MNIVQKLKYKIKALFNHKAINKILVVAGMERLVKASEGLWKNYTIVPGKTEQEIAGYSHITGIQEVIDATHQNIQACFNNYFRDKISASVLDIGCGPGLYLKDFPQGIKKYGVDLSSKMLAIARKNNPDGTFYEGQFLHINFNSTFDLIYLVGVLQYFTPTQINSFFKKSCSLLNKGSILYISYPHAISKNDLSYPDINYIHYSPGYLNKAASEYFEVIQNKHISEDRSISDYDHTPASPPKGIERTYLNSSVFIGKKKD